MRVEVAAMTAAAAYDETSPWRYRTRRETIHVWPAVGRQAHIADEACWCQPRLIHEEGESESYQHRSFH